MRGRGVLVKALHVRRRLAVQWGGIKRVPRVHGRADAGADDIPNRLSHSRADDHPHRYTDLHRWLQPGGARNVRREQRRVRLRGRWVHEQAVRLRERLRVLERKRRGVHLVHSRAERSTDLQADVRSLRRPHDAADAGPHLCVRVLIHRAGAVRSHSRHLLLRQRRVHGEAVRLQRRSRVRRRRVRIVHDAADARADDIPNRRSHSRADESALRGAHWSADARAVGLSVTGTDGRADRDADGGAH